MHYSHDDDLFNDFEDNQVPMSFWNFEKEIHSAIEDIRTTLDDFKEELEELRQQTLNARNEG